MEVIKGALGGGSKAAVRSLLTPVEEHTRSDRN